MISAARPSGTAHCPTEPGGTGAADYTPSPDRDPALPVREAYASPEDPSQAFVDLRPLKKVARALPETDPARLLIEGEPDRLPMAVLAAKADSWVLLLLRGD
jgi:hypothetical protein